MADYSQADWARRLQSLSLDPSGEPAAMADIATGAGQRSPPASGGGSDLGAQLVFRASAPQQIQYSHGAHAHRDQQIRMREPEYGESVPKDGLYNSIPSFDLTLAEPANSIGLLACF